MQEWFIFKGISEPHNSITHLPDPPNWRRFEGKPLVERTLNQANDSERRLGEQIRGSHYQTQPDEIEMVNAALYLRRPLLVTGKPGIGKSTLAYAVAHELQLGSVLRWSITTRATLQDALYRYDAIGRLQEVRLSAENSQQSGADIGRYIRLGPLGTAMLPTQYPRVLLIDEIDKSDVDLPNDLLNIFEEGEYEIPELTRLAQEQEVVYVRPHDGNDTVPIRAGRVRCAAFPFVILTSNGEREFPPAFLRRCLRLTIEAPDRNKLERIIEAHLGSEAYQQAHELIEVFIKRREISKGDLATDQLLNALYMTTRGIDILNQDRQKLLEALLRQLNNQND